jgi:hypothetical protein
MKRFLLALLLCFFLCSTARAECAWVLWFRESPTLPHDWEHWKINEAFPTYKDCSDAQERSFLSLRSTLKNLKKSKGFPVEKVSITEVPNTWMNVWITLETGKKEPLGIFEFKCLPDTIDPRK